MHACEAVSMRLLECKNERYESNWSDFDFM